MVVNVWGLTWMLPIVVIVTTACGGSTDVGVRREDEPPPRQDSGTRPAGTSTGGAPADYTLFNCCCQ